AEVFAQPVKYTQPAETITIGNKLEILTDSFKRYNSTTILSANDFTKSSKNIPVFPVTKEPIWLKFSVANKTTEPSIYFFIQYYNVSEINIYKSDGNRLMLIFKDGNAFKHIPDYASGSFFVSNLQLPPEQKADYYIQLSSKHPVLLPFYIGSLKSIEKRIGQQSFIISTYLGMLIAVFLYNLFLFIATRDRNYLIYIIYIFFLGFAQFTLAGYTFRYFWPLLPVVNNYAVPVTTSLAGVTGILFAMYFLRTKTHTPKAHKVFIVSIYLFLIAIVLSIAGNNDLSYFIIDFNSALAGLISIAASYLIAKKGYRPALYYLISWIFFSIGLVVFSLRNLGILPINNFTTYILYLGSAIEAVLLSIALADKINILKKEKEISQAAALSASLENEQLVREQNIILDQKVTLRTQELQSANTQLNRVLNNLKDTQTQLVEAEKMASLGQLTAGIAHEINNPINFVKSNISPLRLDIKDIIHVLDEYNKLHITPEIKIEEHLKQIKQLQNSIDLNFIKAEIQELIKGIEDGAKRTADIVLGLRTFSRLDEGSVKRVDVHAGIESTLVLLRNSIPWYINIKKQFEARADIECYPGKLNQVFMNLINNGVQAITAKPQKQDESIEIRTRNDEENNIEISIKDTGIGMSEDTKHKIYEPFFTTKEVGEGTGLGMAIVFKIVQSHQGKIEIISEPGKGAEFIITLPCELPEVVVS
ncbi:MAG: 7TM diverse intracellular signaling domain-containing protein, partial [Parafilimonas sp.]